MSDRCIVCLGGLSTGNGDVAALSTTDAKPPPPTGGDVDSALDFETAETQFATVAVANEPEDATAELIAHIQPCGHDLHNECLTPWAERANSCPICRASFHLVEVKEYIGGPVQSTYTVEDRQQVAELDPSMFVEGPEEEDEHQPCQNCGEEDNEDVLMFCDGCDKMWHTYCVGLQEVPFGEWYCDNCRTQRTWNSRPRTSRNTQIGRRRTRGQQRRQRGFQVTHDQNWNAVWQSVWSSINLDLDFPWDDEDTSAAYIRRHRQRNIRESQSAHDAWRARLRIAELQGAGNRFRDTEPTLATTSHTLPPTNRRHRPSPLPETEEDMAWGAFDQARAVSAEPSSSRRGKKRKSRSSSPAQTESETTPRPTPIKRRRTSRSAAPTTIESPRRRRPSRPESPTPRRPILSNDGAGPSFLQSLLQEVESNTAHTHLISNVPRPLRAAGSPPADHVSPRPSSPAGSPLPSNHSSPRGMSPSPPPGANRPGSPTGLSSSIQPIFPSTEFSPTRPTSPPPRNLPNGDSKPQPVRSSSTPLAQPAPRPRVPRIPPILEQANPRVSSPPPHRRLNDINVTQTSPKAAFRADDSSPTRATISLSAKSDIQKLVSAALKPLYIDQTISKDEYTTINRDVSRMLYERIGDFDALGDEQRSKWEKVAGEEVGRAVVALKADA